MAKSIYAGLFKIVAFADFIDRGSKAEMDRQLGIIDQSPIVRDGEWATRPPRGYLARRFGPEIIPPFGFRGIRALRKSLRWGQSKN